SGRDARSLADIEKLIGRKVEVEPLDIEDERRLRGRSVHRHDGQRLRQGPEAEGAAAPARAEPAARAARPVRAAAAQRAPADPLYDRPYEPSLPPDVQPEWEQPAKAPVPKGLSAYIRPKRKVPALLRAPLPALTSPAPVSEPEDTVSG
ncbi:MAG: hypothetical protein P3W97_009015, partial [Tepidimonas sp.]|nr:hypothetical protein [Tepidimonas sp.]